MAKADGSIPSAFDFFQHCGAYAGRCR